MRWLALLMLFAAPAAAEPVIVSAGPERVAVSLYRDPDRESETAIDLKDPRGFAVISETRRVTLPAGPVTIRFEGVASGIQPETAIITGPATAEKNRDARLLSQRGLLDAFTGQAMMLRRTDPATGKTLIERAVLRSDADSLVIQTPRGIESLRCTGLNQTLLAPAVPAGLSAKPVLSMLTRDQPGGTVEITLTYVATRFDWQANYVLEVDPDGEHANVLGWLTMASADDTTFADARASAIAGRVGRQKSDDGDDDEEEEDEGNADLELHLACWPQGTTSGTPVFVPPPPPAPSPMAMEAAGYCDDGCADIVVTGSRVRPKFLNAPIAVTAVQENLGDLKLFRIPVAVTVAARSQKQVAFTSKAHVPGKLVHRVSVDGWSEYGAQRVYRMHNNTKDGLGIALPTGQWALFQQSSQGRALVGETTLADKTEGEDIELQVGDSELSIDIGGRQSNDRYVLTAENPTDEPATLRLEFSTSGYRYPGLRTTERKPGKDIVELLIPAHRTRTFDYRAIDTDH